MDERSGRFAKWHPAEIGARKNLVRMLEKGATVPPDGHDTVTGYGTPRRYDTESERNNTILYQLGRTKQTTNMRERGSNQYMDRRDASLRRVEKSGP